MAFIGNLTVIACLRDPSRIRCPYSHSRVQSHWGAGRVATSPLLLSGVFFCAVAHVGVPFTTLVHCLGANPRSNGTGRSAITRQGAVCIGVNRCAADAKIRRAKRNNFLWICRCATTNREREKGPPHTARALQSLTQAQLRLAVPERKRRPAAFSRQSLYEGRGLRVLAYRANGPRRVQWGRLFFG